MGLLDEITTDVSQLKAYYVDGALLVLGLLLGVASAIAVIFSPIVAIVPVGLGAILIGHAMFVYGPQPTVNRVEKHTEKIVDAD